MSSFVPGGEGKAKADASSGGLTPEQLEEVRRARERARVIRRAASIARVDGGITAVFAVLCLLMMCGGWENLVVGAAFGVVAWNSFRGAARLEKFDVKAPAMLAWNQIFVAGVIIVYALFEIWQLAHGASGMMAMVAGNTKYGGDLGDAGKMIESLQHTVLMILYAVYGSLIGGTVIFQGLMALFYKSRTAHVAAYVEQTPQWVIELENARR